MKTPAGIECSWYYEDAQRRSAPIRQCRVKRVRDSQPWRPGQCERCPVPAIERASGNPNLELVLTLRRGPFGIGTRFRVEAFCGVHGPIDDPYVGCVECAPPVALEP